MEERMDICKQSKLSTGALCSWVDAMKPRMLKILAQAKT